MDEFVLRMLEQAPTVGMLLLVVVMLLRERGNMQEEHSSERKQWRDFNMALSQALAECYRYHGDPPTPPPLPFQQKHPISGAGSGVGGFDDSD